MFFYKFEKSKLQESFFNSMSNILIEFHHKNSLQYGNEKFSEKNMKFVLKKQSFRGANGTLKYFTMVWS